MIYQATRGATELKVSKVCVKAFLVLSLPFAASCFSLHMDRILDSLLFLTDTLDVEKLLGSELSC